MMVDEDEHSIAKDCSERVFLNFPVPSGSFLNTVSSEVVNSTNVHEPEHNDSSVG